MLWIIKILVARVAKFILKIVIGQYLEKLTIEQFEVRLWERLFIIKSLVFDAAKINNKLLNDSPFKLLNACTGDLYILLSFEHVVPSISVELKSVTITISPNDTKRENTNAKENLKASPEVSTNEPEYSIPICQIQKLSNNHIDESSEFRESIEVLSQMIDYIIHSISLQINLIHIEIHQKESDNYLAVDILKTILNTKEQNKKVINTRFNDSILLMDEVLLHDPLLIPKVN
jgi:hypothetical protein